MLDVINTPPPCVLRLLGQLKPCGFPFLGKAADPPPSLLLRLLLKLLADNMQGDAAGGLLPLCNMLYYRDPGGHMGHTVKTACTDHTLKLTIAQALTSSDKSLYSDDRHAPALKVTAKPLGDSSARWKNIEGSIDASWQLLRCYREEREAHRPADGLADESVSRIR